MSSKRSLIKKFKAPMLLILLTILLSFLVPSVFSEPINPSKRNEVPTNGDLAYNLDAYFMVVNYNEPSNPWILVNYYFENGSSIRMVLGIDRMVFPSLNLDYQNNFIQVFDKKGKVCGLGFKTGSKSNLFIYAPV